MRLDIIHKSLRFILLLCALFTVGFFHAQTGNYYITNYSPAQYQSTEQNRGFVQDNHGRLYSANLSGALFFDGEYWKVIELKNKSAALSIDKDKLDRVFVGGESQFGYLSQKNNGDLIYNSISELLPKSSEKFGEVWNTICTEKFVFFGSNYALAVYDYNKVYTIASHQDSLFHNFFKIDNKLFVRQFNVGFKVFKNNTLVKVEGSEIFANIKVRFILPKSSNEYWLGTENGMYVMLYDKFFPEKSKFYKSPSPIDDWMITNLVYSGVKLKNNEFIIGSQTKGIVHVDQNFSTIKSLNSSTGLQDDKIFNVFEDHAGNIWLGLSNGITFIELNSPVTKWTKSDGINGTIESACKFNNNLMIGTNKGLQIHNIQKNEFETTELFTEIWDLQTNTLNLFIASTDGLYTYNGKDFELPFEGTVYKINIDKKNNKKIYFGGDDIIGIGEIFNGKLNMSKTIKISGQIRYLLQKEDKLYYGANNSDIGVIDLKNFTEKHFTEKNGLPSLTDNMLFEYDGNILVGTNQGIYTLVEKEDTLLRENKYNIFSKETEIQITRPTVINGEIWFDGAGTIDKVERIQEISTLKSVGHKAIKDNKYLKRIRDVSPKQFYQTDSLIYISTNNGLFCYNLNFKNKPIKYLTIINSILAKSDTLLYNVCDKKVFDKNLDFSKNDIHFNLAATSFIDGNELEFSYYLEGKDSTYDKWTKNNSCAFSNLHEGTYTFHAYSRDVLGNEGEEISFSFTILPPWYRTVWAYISYFILFVIVVYVIVKLNTKRLRAQNVKLENTITERTKTIAHQMVEIEHKNKEITDSINYAKGIQDSILPDTKDIISTWKDTFVYFQPKDIVSGDFFWYKKLNDHEFLIACADCTGHGVPGGFMSMICSDKLHDSAKDFTEPKDILFGTNNGVKTTLKQQVIVEGKSKDGMEICLLKVNTQTQEVSYSGANRLLWIVDTVTKELTEIKPTKASIASFTEFNFEYQQHDFKLKKGDIIYATSDGYPDQFGGHEGKKYMSKKMKAFLLSICDKPMSEQHDLLKAEINDWMMGHEQVDDLLVIGVRL